MRPIVYLDIDDVLIAWPPSGGREAAPHANSFLRWLLEHVEVRWLTAWCPSGTMSEERRHKLAGILDMDPAELEGISNPLAFKPIHRWPPKHEAIDFAADRPWLVVQDEHWHRDCLTALEEAGAIDRYIETNTSRRPDDLLRV